MPLTAANIADLVSVSTYGLDFEAKAIWNGATTNWLKVMCNRTHKEVQLFYVAQFMHVMFELCAHTDIVKTTGRKFFKIYIWVYE